MSTLLSFFKYAVIFVVFVLVTSTVGWDLERHDGGYLRPIFYWIFGYFSLARAEVVEICETPLASLTIAKIFKLVWHLCVPWFILSFGYAIWSMIRDFLESHRENQDERERLEEIAKRDKEEEARFHAESSQEGAELVSKMCSSSDQSELDSILFQSLDKWPKWERQLFRMYEERKTWLKKNIPDE